MYSQLRTETLQAYAAWLQRPNLTIHTQAGYYGSAIRVLDELRRSRALGSCIRAGIDLIAHCVWMDSAGNLDYRAELVDEMVARNIYVGMTASGIYRRLLPNPEDTPAERESKLEQLRAHLSYVPLRSMRAAGVKIMVHSDAGVRFTPFNTFVANLQAMQIGLDLTVIQAATQVPVEALGLSNEIGTLQPGKRADLIAVDMDPLEDITRIGEVALVLKDGSTVGDRGHVSIRPSYFKRRLSRESRGPKHLTHARSGKRRQGA